MSFYLSHLSFTNFRNYQGFDLDISSLNTVIIGRNAIGKTNILEGIQLLTAGISFRNPQWDDVIYWGEESAIIKICAQEEKRNLDCKLIIKDNKRYYSINEKGKKASEIQGHIPAILFVPDDLALIKGNSDKRREAIDKVGVQLSPVYFSIKKDYERVIRQRNTLLKLEAPPQDILESWTSSLVDIGLIFFEKRSSLFQLLREEFITIFNQLSPHDETDCFYLPSWREKVSEITKESFSSLLFDLREKEIERGVTLLGPHRDEVLFTINNRDARQYGSQGQQRTLVLAWKLAEVEVIRKVSQKRPVLLLDDVMSELDEEKRQFFLQYINNKTQTFITTTNENYFTKEFLKEAAILNLPS